MNLRWLFVLLSLAAAPTLAADDQPVVNSNVSSIESVHDQRQVPPKPTVDLRWIESTRVENVTEEMGFPGSCGLCDSLYPHKKPALVLTAAEVAEARVTEHDLSKNGLGILYTVTLVLTIEAREQLAATCPGKSARLTVGVDGRYWGWRHYTTDNDAKVSELSKAKNFNASIGFMSSKADAESIVNAFRKADHH